VSTGASRRGAICRKNGPREMGPEQARTPIPYPHLTPGEPLIQAAGVEVALELRAQRRDLVGPVSASMR
jgi:hypothetical protein